MNTSYVIKSWYTTAEDSLIKTKHILDSTKAAIITNYINKVLYTDTVGSLNLALITVKGDVIAANIQLGIATDSLIKKSTALKDTIKYFQSQGLYIKWFEDSTTITSIHSLVGNFDISIYPNPTSGNVHITSTETVKEITLYDLQGKVILHRTPNSESDEFTLSPSDTPVGTYIFKVSTSKGVSYQKLIVTK
jgi:hypothetical protein